MNREGARIRPAGAVTIRSRIIARRRAGPQRDAAPSPRESTPAAPGTPGARTVIVADDALPVRDRFRAALENAGHTVIALTDAADLLGHVRRDTGVIDLILLDLQLPPGPGVALVRSLRAIDGSVPVLIFSGTVSSAAEVRQLAEIGVAGYLNEHSAPQLILPAVAAHLSRDTQNRRGSARVVLGAPVQYRFGNTIAAALTLNLGRGGVAIRTSSPLEADARVRVRFRWPGSPRDVESEGRVVWSDRRVGMGVQFEPLDAASQTIVDNFVDAHLPGTRQT